MICPCGAEARPKLPRAHGPATRYCSQPCKDRARRRPPDVDVWATCARCQAPFVQPRRRPRKHCSSACSYGVGVRRRFELIKPCERCGRSFSVPRRGRRESRFCSVTCARKSALSEFERKQKKRAADAIRTARRRGLQGAGVGFDWRMIADRDGWRCYLCGAEVLASLRGTYEAEAPEIDHVVPVARGGEHKPENVRLTHRRCNLRKAARRVEEARGA